MSFKVDISHTLLDAYSAFDQLEAKEVTRAAKRAINRTLVTLRKEAVPVIQKELRVKSTLLKSYMFLNKAEGKAGSKISGSLEFKSKGFPLIDFVRGAKRPTPQKGVKVKNRKKVKVEIKPGHQYVVKGGFIANSQNRGLQVFKRVKSDRKKLLMQTSPSLGKLLLNETKNKIGSSLQTRGVGLFRDNFLQDLKYRTSAAFKEAQKGRLSKIRGSSRRGSAQL